MISLKNCACLDFRNIGIDISPRNISLNAGSNLGVFRMCFSITWPHSIGILPVKNMSSIITGNFFIKKPTICTTCVERKENWRILTNKEIYARLTTPTVIGTIRLNRLH